MDELKKAEDIFFDDIDFEVNNDGCFLPYHEAIKAIKEAQRNAIEALHDLSVNRVFHKACEEQIGDCRCELLKKINSTDK